MLLLAAVAVLTASGCSKKEDKTDPAETTFPVDVVDPNMSQGFEETAEPYVAPPEQTQPPAKGDASLVAPIDTWWEQFAFLDAEQASFDKAVTLLTKSLGSKVPAAQQMKIGKVASDYIVADTTGAGRAAFPTVWSPNVLTGTPVYESVEIIGVGVDTGSVDDDRVEYMALVAWADSDGNLHLTFTFHNKDGAPIPSELVDGWASDPQLPNPIKVK